MTVQSTKALLLSSATTQAAAIGRKMLQKTQIPSTVSVSEITLPLKDGMTLAGQRWTYNSSTNAKTHKILALHGWLDNSSSFHYLAPHLVDKLGGKAELVALDLPGHGLSSHKSLDGPPTLLSEGVYYVAEALDQLGWTKDAKDPAEDHDDGLAGGTDPDDSTNGVTLVGHSMGGGLSLVYAAAFPENVKKMVLLDIYSPLPGECDKTTSLLRSHIEARKKGKRPNRVYPNIDQAVQSRQMTAAKAPGKQWLSLEAATEMVTRAMVPVKDGDTEGYSFRHDTRLLWPSLQHFMPEQIDSVMKFVECPTCILAAEHGWPFKQDRVDRAVEILQPTIHKVLPGSHHFHADPETSEAVLDEVYQFVYGKNMKYVL